MQPRRHATSQRARAKATSRIPNHVRVHENENGPKFLPARIYRSANTLVSKVAAPASMMRPFVLDKVGAPLHSTVAHSAHLQVGGVNRLRRSLKQSSSRLVLVRLRLLVVIGV